MGRAELPYRRQKTPRMRREAAFGVFCLTTVYPTSTHGAHGNSGGKSAGKDVFASGKGRKWLETSGNRYSGFLWEQDAAGSNPVTRTISSVHNGFELWTLDFITGYKRSDEYTNAFLNILTFFNNPYIIILEVDF